MGDHGTRHPWWTPLRVVLALATVVLALGMTSKAACVPSGWQGGSHAYTALCWSDVATTYVDDGYAEGQWPFTSDADARARYGASGAAPLPAYLARLTAAATRALDGSPDTAERQLASPEELAERGDVRREARIFTILNAVVLAALAMVASGLLTGVVRRRPWDAAGFAAAPLLALAWPVSWDLLGAAAVAVALWAWSRQRPAVTGVALGLGAAATVLPGLLVVPAVALAVRAREWRTAGLVAVAGAATWAVVALPAFLGSPDAWRSSWGLGRVGVGSVWLIVAQATDTTPAAGLVAGVGVAVVLAWSAVVVGIALTLPRPPPLASLGLLTLVGGMLALGAAPAPTALVLLPLAAVAVPRWRDLLVWQACEVFHFAMSGFYLGEALAPTGGGDARAYWLAVVVRLVGLLWLVAAVLRNLQQEAMAHPGGQAMSTRSNDVAV